MIARHFIEGTYRVAEHFHLLCGMPFLVKELLHVARHLLNRSVKHAVTKVVRK